MNRQNHEESLGQFEQLTEQYMTYTASSQLAQINNKNQRKIIGIGNAEKAKLKMVNQGKQKANLDSLFGTSTKKQRKFNSPHAKIISIGDAIFRSNFQSGNIQTVQKIAPATYQITLTKQLNSDRISAWFYFIVEGLKGQAKFVIKGFTKSSSLYNEGMKICYKQTQENVWRRGGTKIYYTDTYSQNYQERTSYELHFTYFFKSNHPNSVQFAYCFPYTYQHLLKFLTMNQNKIISSSLGKTFQGREIPLLTIGNNQSNKVIIISARAHPGQTVGSHMMQGFIKELINDSEHSKYLRQAYLFKIVPMINPDGVANGNYRFSGSGFDLNRKWKTCSMKMHPEVYLFKQKIRQINKDKQIIMFMDFHGHSRQKNVFFYGCAPQQPIDQNGNQNTKPRQFPFLMSKLHSAFRYEYSSYAMQKQKQGTARITLWNQIKSDYIYTVQASLSGTDSMSFLMADYEKVGAKLCEGIFLHFWKQIKQGLPKQKQIQSPAFMKINEQIAKNMSQFFENPELAKIQYEGKSSDSEPEAGQIPETDRKKQKSAISIQKYYKASRVMKFADKSFADEEMSAVTKNKNHLHNAIIGKYKVELLNSRNKTNESVRVMKQSLGTQSNMLPPDGRCAFKNLSAQMSSKSHSQQTCINQKPECLTHPVNQRKKLQYTKNNNTTSLENSYNQSLRLASQSFVIKNQSEQDARNQLEKNKKKAVSFQGAQYRRVRKLAEQHNKRHYSAQNSFMQIQDETLRKGLIGTNKMVEIQIVGSGNRQRAPSFFPNTTFYSKTRKGSVETHFRRQIKASDYTSRRFYVNGMEQQVKCWGKQIF